jgi:transcriptional regulator with XRE-family HTH domain
VPRKTNFASSPTCEGVRKLRELTGGVAELAKNIGVAISTVSDWRSCKKIPNQAAREKIARAYPDVRPDDWDGAKAPAKLKRPKPEAKRSDQEDQDLSDLATIEQVSRVIREARASQCDLNITTTTREKLITRELRALQILHQMEEQEPVTLDKIAQSPHWIELSSALRAAIRDCERCSAAVETAVADRFAR